MIATALIFIGGLLWISWKAFIDGTYTEGKIFEFLFKLISRNKKSRDPWSSLIPEYSFGADLIVRDKKGKKRYIVHIADAHVLMMYTKSREKLHEIMDFLEEAVRLTEKSETCAKAYEEATPVIMSIISDVENTEKFMNSLDGKQKEAAAKYFAEWSEPLITAAERILDGCKDAEERSLEFARDIVANYASLSGGIAENTDTMSELMYATDISELEEKYDDTVRKGDKKDYERCRKRKTQKYN